MKRSQVLIGGAAVVLSGCTNAATKALPSLTPQALHPNSLHPRSPLTATANGKQFVVTKGGATVQTVTMESTGLHYHQNLGGIVEDFFVYFHDLALFLPNHPSMQCGPYTVDGIWKEGVVNGLWLSQGSITIGGTTVKNTLFEVLYGTPKSDKMTVTDLKTGQNLVLNEPIPGTNGLKPNISKACFGAILKFDGLGVAVEVSMLAAEEPADWLLVGALFLEWCGSEQDIEAVCN